MQTWIKVCGCTSIADARMAVEAGADAIGVIFAPSPRQIDLERAAAIAARVPDSVPLVGVFADAPSGEVELVARALPRMLLQFSGSEPAAVVMPFGARAIKVIHVGADDTSERIAARSAAYPDVKLLFDTHTVGRAGGSGTTFAWEDVGAIARTRSTIVAGGLRPENVGDCVRAVRPFGVDVRSGVERDGRKDAALVRAFVRAVREADAA